MTLLQKKIYDQIRGCCVSDTSAECAALKAVLVIQEDTEHITQCREWIPDATCKFNNLYKCNLHSCNLTRQKEE